MASQETIQVALGERAYPIHVVAGGLDGLGAALAEQLRPGRVVLVTNPVVGALYQEAALASLAAAGFEPSVLHIPDGERYKTLATWSDLVSRLLDQRVDRATAVIALGGGVTGDMVGFAASSVLRGVPFVQVPTTLLSMVDASVGGKTGFNTPHGKNLVGAFYQPRMVYAAMDVLATLDQAEWRCGLGESLKHGVIKDATLADWMGEHADALREREPHATAQLVRRCCEIKADVVAADEREAGLRAILNFGHTVGHALETALGHGSLRHGEAVALGMLVETKFSQERGWSDAQGLLPRLTQLTRALDLPVSLPREHLGNASASFGEKLAHALRMDKKTVRGRLRLVAPISMGAVRLVTARAEDLVALLELTESWEIS
jgi:3-dehydroquinate synthase